MNEIRFVVWLAAAMLLLVVSSAAAAEQEPSGEVRLVRKKHDPYGSPRPAMGQEHVPLRTTFYMQLAAGSEASPDEVLPESVSLTLQPKCGEAVAVLKPGPRFADGYGGRIFPGKTRKERTLEVYVDPQQKLEPKTTYTIQVQARSRNGAELSSKSGSWQFTTEAAPRTHTVEFDVSLDVAPVKWSGAFFSGFCKPSFCTSFPNRVSSFELMDEVRQSSPKAWSLQRDFTLTGMETGPPKLLPMHWPNIVRERETRRISAIEALGDDSLLHVEDFFGHQQYGIESNRPLGEDFHKGDDVLIADPNGSDRATVVAVDEQQRTVRVSKLNEPDGGWKLDYSAPLPTKENPTAPGLFPSSGCYLHKFAPSGTPTYYWKRLDLEWDLAVKQFKRRQMPNFTDASGDLAIDGRAHTTAKDYAQWHEVVQTIAGHIIDRYGDAALEFPWSVFNEPDLGVVFWRSDWIELQKFYDYTVDGVLRAFEDRGYDSNRVMVGGLELGAIFGVHMRLQDFLVHCSPRADATLGAPVRKGRPTTLLLPNAAFADHRLNGKRSKRVESLCRKHAGRGSPCDFISIHAYNTSKLMADKLTRAKEIALEIDEEYYADLWINSHESCPGWDMPPDPAYRDSYLGNGYFPTWCTDVMRRQLQRAATDGRYAFGETILTLWPWPSRNFDGGAGCTRVIQVDDDEDGLPDRSSTIAMPILNFLALTNQMGDEYWVLPEQTIDAHTVSGFASRLDGRTQLVLYSHAPLDTEARSEQSFDVTVNLSGVEGRKVAITQYRFDKDHNSYFYLGRSLREERIATSMDASDETKRRVQAAIQKLESSEKPTVLQGLRELAEIGSAVQPFVELLVPLALQLQNSSDAEIQAALKTTAQRISSQQPYPASVVRQVEELATLRPTATSTQSVDNEGHLRLQLTVSSNGANVAIIEHD